MDEKRFLSLEDISLKRGRNTVISSLSYNLPIGKNLCIIGSMASGKTTLIDAICGNIPIYSGRVIWHILEKNGYVFEQIGYLPQRHKLPVHFIEDQYYQRRFNSTALDNIPTVKELVYKLTTDIECAHRVILDTQLESLIDMPYMLLSNGQTRRLGLACVLVKTPKFLLLDQPFTGLDGENSLMLSETLNHLNTKGIHYILGGEIPQEVSLHNMQFLDIDAKSTAKRAWKIPESPSEMEIRVDDEREIVVSFKNLNIQYGKKKVFENFNWEVHSGEHWLLQGANGSGKSTLISLIFADHPQAYSNDIMILGMHRGNGESIWEVKKEIGFFSPELLRYYDKPITVLQVIHSGYQDIVGLITIPHDTQIDKIRQFLGLWQIEDLEERIFTQLSFGEQRMVLLLRAMIKYPKLLLLDEPLQGLDEHTKLFLIEQIRDFCKDITLIYIAHHPSEMLPYYDHTLRL
jgi:molybdate transport system ATP-binding protein